MDNGGQTTISLHPLWFRWSTLEYRHKAYFMGHDRNDESCLLAKAFAPKVREERARLEALVQPLLAKMRRESARSLLHRLRFWAGRS